MKIYDRCVDRHFEKKRRRGLWRDRFRRWTYSLSTELCGRNFPSLEDVFRRESEALSEDPKYREDEVR